MQLLFIVQQKQANKWVIRVFCRFSPCCLLSLQRIWPQWTGSHSVWEKRKHLSGVCGQGTIFVCTFKVLDLPVQKLGNIWICLSRAHDRSNTIPRINCYQNKLYHWKHGVVHIIQNHVQGLCSRSVCNNISGQNKQSLTCVLLSGKRSEQSARLHWSFLQTIGHKVWQLVLQNIWTGFPSMVHRSQVGLQAE